MTRMRRLNAGETEHSMKIGGRVVLRVINLIETEYLTDIISRRGCDDCISVRARVILHVCVRRSALSWL